jgi:hypothetical protein
MRPNVNSLAMRRPALAALLGILPSEGHFGSEPTFGNEFGLDDELEGEFGFGDEGQLNAASMGDHSFARNQIARGDVRQIDVNRDAFRNLVGQRNMLRSDLTSDQRKLNHLAQLRDRREERAVAHQMRLDPNHGQSLKLGTYSFGLSQAITIGIAVGLFMSDSPACTLRTKRVVMNAPGVGFATVSNLLIANVATTIGGAEDAFAYSAQSFSNEVDYPTLPPSQKATMTGNYTGFAPAPLFNGQSYTFSVRFSGTSTIAGGA